MMAYGLAEAPAGLLIPVGTPSLGTALVSALVDTPSPGTVLIPALVETSLLGTIPLGRHGPTDEDAGRDWTSFRPVEASLQEEGGGSLDSNTLRLLTESLLLASLISPTDGIENAPFLFPVSPCLSAAIFADLANTKKCVC